MCAALAALVSLFPKAYQVRISIRFCTFVVPSLFREGIGILSAKGGTILRHNQNQGCLEIGSNLVVGGLSLQNGSSASLMFLLRRTGF